MAKSQTIIIPGPPTTRVSRAQAEDKLKGHPRFPKGSSYAIEEVEGRWVAAFTVEAAPPFGGGDEAPANDAAPTPPSDDSAPEGDDGASADNFDGSDEKLPGEEGKPGEGDEKGEKGGGELGEIKHMLTTLLTAMGLGGPDASMLGGEEVGPPDAGHDPTAPPAEPPHGSDDMDPRDNKTHTVHERALKPGEAPPGTTPVGAPSFASVRIPDDHPWHDRIASGDKEWVATDYMEDGEPIKVIANELKALAEPYGYKVQQLQAGVDSAGNRVARARIARVV
jgi:hypothetical protein